MISGTMIGDNSSAVISRLNGMTGDASPTAAKVPSTVARNAEAMPMMKLFWIASIQLPSRNMAAYQRVE